ncbi:MULTISPECIES: OmpA family protein [unclassified Flavobacterium]|uniref:OmpA family protein n=1 Tax=unclassified Flavobacterium TaxID=196869 RepID=UPI001F14894F|nr:MULTISPECIES: OmpA family protein [unclassified Flavobacterium]UMY66297.1 OmpA family protein [Flavobacterium sp. HJ-32-4]
MKKVLLTLAFVSFAVANTFGQSDSTYTGSDYNKWSIEVGAGVNKPFKAFTERYRSGVEPLTVNLGARYMFNTKFGLKLTGELSKFKDFDSSLPFESQYITANLQGVFNLGRIMNFEQFTKSFNLLAHAGAGWYQLTFDGDGAAEGQDNGINFMGGLTGQIKLSKRIVFNLDATLYANSLQQKNFDGYGTIDGQVFDAWMLTATGGFTFYLGSKDVHADWYIESDKTKEQLDALEKRVGDLETMLNDTDKDGVPDYLDAEPNTTTGVAVNSKGQAIDNNGNGVPDELESYMTKTYGDPTKSATSSSTYVSNNELIRNLINEGYVCSYFNFNESKPTNVSTEGIDFILTYLRNNPKANVEIIGHADEIGRTAYNDQLSVKRAEAVKAILVKAKIDASRLKVVPAGEDRSVDSSSDGARKLVRRVTFRVN